MSLPIQPKSGPVNRAAFIAGVAGVAAGQFWPTGNSGVLATGFAGLCASVSVLIGTRALILLVRDYHQRRKLKKAEEASSDHGTARQAEWHELVARMMHEAGSGNLLGLHRKAYPVWSPPKTPFSLIEMPPGAGKTVNYVIGSILHQARLGKSLFIPDVKAELAPMLVAALKALKIEVWCVNPARMHFERCGDVEINLYQAVIDAVHDKGDFRKDAVKLGHDLADLHLPEPSGGEDKNVYFRNGSKRCIALVILAQALLDPAHCTPSDVFATLNDPVRFRKLLIRLRYELPKLMPGDAIAAFLQNEAATMADLFKENAENAQSFLQGATQRLITFNQGGRMAGHGRTASVNIADMRKRQIVMFVIAPLSHTRDFAPVVSLLNYSLLEAAKRNPAGHPIHIVGEEALNFRFNDIAGDMETMRGLKISADLYIQSFNGLVRKLGRDAANSIEAYSDIKIYAGLTLLDRARHVSEMLAEATIRRQDYSFKDDVADINVSSGELGRRLATADEILAMDRNDAWVFVRGLRPMKLSMIDYGRIDPWRDEVADNPLEGTRLRGETAFTIRYPGRDERLSPGNGEKGIGATSATALRRFDLRGAKAAMAHHRLAAQGRARDAFHRFVVRYSLIPKAWVLQFAPKPGAAKMAGPIVEGIRYPSTSVKSKRRMLAPVRLKHLLWLPPVLVLAFADLTSLPTPHLRYSATYSGSPEAGLRFYQRCHYVGLHARTIHPSDGKCPVVDFFPNK